MRRRGIEEKGRNGAEKQREAALRQQWLQGRKGEKGYRGPIRLSRMSQRNGGTLKRAEYNLHMGQWGHSLLEERS